MSDRASSSRALARALVLFILLAAVGAGIGVYYTNNYAYYEKSELKTLVLARPDGGAEGALRLPLKKAGQALSSSSSPLRFRACLELDAGVLHALSGADYMRIERVEPRIAPKIFPCFDAKIIAEALAEARATAFLSRADILPGIDRVGAFFPDGRVFLWHRLSPDHKF